MAATRSARSGSRWSRDANLATRTGLASQARYSGGSKALKRFIMGRSNEDWSNFSVKGTRHAAPTATCGEEARKSSVVRMPGGTQVTLPSDHLVLEENRMESSHRAGVPANGARRISSTVSLTLLQVLRAQDLPTEILQDEDPTQTMPRKFGLSDVVGRQISSREADVKKGLKTTDGEFFEMINFVIRRPDSEEIFTRAGQLLAGADNEEGARGTRLPKRLALAMARRRVRRQLMALFGRRVGGFAEGDFTLEGQAHLLIQGDPGGEACLMLSGFCQRVLARTLRQPAWVSHVSCEAHGDALCRWVGSLEPSATPGTVSAP